MNISAAADAAGLPVKTVRYYADIGPGCCPFHDLPLDIGHMTMHRSESWRSFGGQGSSGSTLGECRELLDLYEDQNRSSADVKQIASKKLEENSGKAARATGTA